MFDYLAGTPVRVFFDLFLKVILINGKNWVSVSILVSVSTKIHGIGIDQKS
jgi:hypothetical protein